MGRPPARVASGKRGLRHDVGDADVVEDVSGSRNVRFSQDVILCPQTLPILEENGSACVHCPSTSLAMPTFSAWLISSSSAKSSPGTEASRLAAAPVQCVKPLLVTSGSLWGLKPLLGSFNPPGGLQPLPVGFGPSRDSAAGSSPIWGGGSSPTRTQQRARPTRHHPTPPQTYAPKLLPCTTK